LIGVRPVLAGEPPLTTSEYVVVTGVALFLTSKPGRIFAMKYLIPLLLVGSSIALTTTEANAVVCAAGVYRAGCVAARPVVVAPRAVARRAVVVAPRRAVVVRRRVY
jgi:hypothetical protein